MDYTDNVTEAVRRYEERRGNTHFNPKAALIDMDGTSRPATNSTSTRE